MIVQFNLLKWELRKDVAVHRSLIFDKVGVQNQGLSVSRNLDTDLANYDFVK